MGEYIERERCGEYLNPTSSTTCINGTDCCCGCNNPSQSDDYGRWNWLIKNWDKMTFKERLSIFFPKIHYIDLRNSFKVDFDNDVNVDIVDKGYEWCRNVSLIHFDPDRQGIPNLLIEYDPVNVQLIPDYDTKEKVLLWGREQQLIT